MPHLTYIHKNKKHHVRTKDLPPVVHMVLLLICR
nr:MAG TPA: hypothetical protein [Caudoviricetes sp.]DAY17177.1 MAG TPA: hypothetical protein [Caudoviricetes sp.]